MKLIDDIKLDVGPFLRRLALTVLERRSLFVRGFWRFNPHSHDHLKEDGTPMSGDDVKQRSGAAVVRRNDYMRRRREAFIAQGLTANGKVRKHPQPKWEARPRMVWWRQGEEDGGQQTT